MQDQDLNREPRPYRFLDPDKIDTTGMDPIEGTNAQCLADALLDVFQLSADAGFTEEELEEALTIFTDGVARRQRLKFRLHIKDD
jgi:hypothetical protein